MIREHWRDPRFWRWFWRNRAPQNAKLSAALLVAATVLVGGYFAADRLSGARAGVTALTYETTVEKAVTVREHGKTIVRRVPVVRRVVLRPQTVLETRFDTRVITAPGGVRLVRQPVVKYVPVVRRHVITVNGSTQTITQTKLVPTTTIKTQTLTNVVTNQQTVFDQSTVTVVNNRIVPVTVTESHTDTVVETQTLPAETVTLPPVTVTETVPLVTVTLP